jgi:AcrR family transcriptional regulator
VADVNPRKRYSSPLRQQQAATTRRAVLDAARELFTSQGYAATTIDQIADRAGVSKPTVFSAVGSKQTLLRSVRDVAIAGDEEPVAVQRRPHIERIRVEPDQRRAAALIARHLSEVASRYAEIFEVVRAAAHTGDEELRKLWEAEEAERLQGARLMIDTLRAKGPLRAGVSTNVAIDLMWWLMAPDHYHRLVHGRGWTKQKYGDWLATSIRRLLLADAP